MPVAALSATVEAEPGRAVRRVRVTLRHDDKPVASGLAVMVRAAPINEGRSPVKPPCAAGGLS